MKFANMPALFALLAGFVVSVATILSGMELLKSLIWIFAAILIFYILGCAIRSLFNVILSEDPVDLKEIITDEDAADGTQADDKK